MRFPQEISLFEDAYAKACHQVEMVHVLENTRQLRLQMLLLEDVNDELHDQIEQADGRIEELESYAVDLQEDVEALTEKKDSAEGDLRIRTRENETLKVIAAGFSMRR